VRSRPFIVIAMALVTSCTGRSATISSRVPAADLHAAGLIATPATSSSTISRAQAIARVHGRVVAAELRHVVDPRRRPPLSADVWIISTDPHDDNQAAGPPGSSAAPQRYAFTLINAHTGAFIESDEGS
jgi:hypothetical protein